MSGEIIAIGASILENCGINTVWHDFPISLSIFLSNAFPAFHCIWIVVQHKPVHMSNETNYVKHLSVVLDRGLEIIVNFFENRQKHLPIFLPWISETGDMFWFSCTVPRQK